MRRLEPAALKRRTTSSSLESLGFAGLEQACRVSAAAHAPERGVRHDPRDERPFVYSPARRQRLGLPDHLCAVCDEQTCPAVDVVELPHGDRAWLTPNLYPICFPFEHEPGVEPAESRGVHLVHWSSLHHGKGLPGADEATAAAIMRQLARAEGFLLHGADAGYPVTSRPHGDPDGTPGAVHRGHVGVIKNRGRRVGGSVEHDHQQIMLMALAPNEPARTVGLGPRLLVDTPEALVVERTHGLVTTLVPDFMWRPLHAFIVPHGPPAGWLHHLDGHVLDALAVAMGRLFAATTRLMVASHGEPAWNAVIHTGEGCSPLVELRPFTQPLGGYEHLGVWLCEETPEQSAARLREAVAG